MDTDGWNEHLGVRLNGARLYAHNQRWDQEFRNIRVQILTAAGEPIGCQSECYDLKFNGAIKAGELLNTTCRLWYQFVPDAKHHKEKDKFCEAKHVGRVLISLKTAVDPQCGKPIQLLPGEPIGLYAEELIGFVHERGSVVIWIR